MSFQPQIFTLPDVASNVSRGPWLANPDDPLYEIKILAEGDSWFSIGAIPSSNVLIELRLEKQAILINLAKPGDTLLKMADMLANPDLAKAMSTDTFGWQWDVILFSGGGNDLIGFSDNIVIKASQYGSRNPEAYVNRSELNKLLEHVEAKYRDIVALRDKGINKDTPIVVHTYDYISPSDAQARLLNMKVVGPWLKPVMENALVPVDVQKPVSDILFGALAERICSLSQGPQALPYFFAVNTLSTVIPAAPDSTGATEDWLNEIHPTAQGYSKIAAKLNPVINQLINKPKH